MKQLVILAVMMVMTISAKAISYEDAKDDALFLTDKMAYELSLTDELYEKYLTIEYFYRPVKWESDAWVFLVYSHYARDFFYFTHPKVYDTYLGGNCFKSARFYADRIAHKPASPDHHHTPAAHGTAPAPAPNNAASQLLPITIRQLPTMPPSQRLPTITPSQRPLTITPNLPLLLTITPGRVLLIADLLVILAVALLAVADPLAVALADADSIDISL